MAVTIREEMGYVLAVADDEADMEHRWWFDRTEKDRLVFVCEVIEDGGASGAQPVRHYVEESEADVPDRVRDAIRDDGWEMEIVDTSGHPL